MMTLHVTYERDKIFDAILIFIYITLIHILYIFFFKDTFLTSYSGKLFVFSFNSHKYFLCLAETVLFFWHALKSMKTGRLTETIVFFLDLMYFIPGAVQQAVTNMEWSYMLYFFAFWLGIVLWMNYLKPHKYSYLSKIMTTRQPEIYVFLMVILALCITVFMSVYMGRFLTASNFLATVNDIYGVRAESSNQAVHWILTNLEYWAAYFMVAAIGFYSERKKWNIVAVLMIGELSLFVLQGNRIILFLAIVAVLIGIFNIDNRKLLWGLVAVLVLCLIEVNIKRAGFIVTDTFRRFTVVPNRLSEQYFDYFTSNEPDYLRSLSDRIVQLLGLSSPYYSPNIGRIIGKEYYGTTMNANTGLVGGAAFCFGMLGPILTTFGYIFAFRMFEGAMASLKKSKMVMAVALFLGSLVINSPALLKGIFSLSYIMMLYVSFIPLSQAYYSALQSDGS